MPNKLSDWEKQKQEFLSNNKDNGLSVNYKAGSDLVLIQGRWFKMFKGDDDKVNLQSLE